VCVCVCLFVCVCVFVYVYVYVCVCVFHQPYNSNEILHLNPALGNLEPAARNWWDARLMELGRILAWVWSRVFGSVSPQLNSAGGKTDGDEDEDEDINNLDEEPEPLWREESLFYPRTTTALDSTHQNAPETRHRRACDTRHR
jgi:hypothetical protein